MPSALARNTTISGQSGNRANEERPLSSQPTARKMPTSQKFEASDLANILSKVDDVVFMRLPDVKAVTGLSKTRLYALIKEKSFPAPIHLGPRVVAWVKSEIRQWAIERVQASRSAA
jgi:prophage regulatory protein